MKLTFESNLQYQLDVINTITGLFEGQSLEDALIKNVIKFDDNILNNISAVGN